MSAHRARKRFGQHFLHDRTVIHRIVSALDAGPADRVIEIGPGLGALTEPLLATGADLTVIELDRDLAARLRAAHPSSSLTVIEADALKVDLVELAAGQTGLRIVGNLPYNITTPLIFHLLGAIEVIRDLHVMVQKEVADRLAAGPGDKAYGRLSVMVAARVTVTREFNVGPGAFNPPPRVDSSVISLRPHDSPPADIPDPAAFSLIVREAFSQRRKTLRRSLASRLSVDQIAACDIDPGARPETLDLAGFAALARAVSPLA